jgi:hypothetical protein
MLWGIWNEWSVEYTLIVGRVDGRWMEWMGDGEGMKWRTHDVYRVWGWWVLQVLLGTFLKEIPPYHVFMYFISFLIGIYLSISLIFK